MSEDHARIQFSVERPINKKREAIVSLISEYTQECGGTVNFNEEGCRVRVDIEFCSLGFGEIEAILLGLEKLGATNVICASWFDNVGEKAVSSLFDGKLETFGTLDELEEYREEVNRKKVPPLDYGKDRRNQTAIVRMKIKSEAKRKKLVGFFRDAIGIRPDSGFDRFMAGFDGLVKSKTHDVQWCKFRWSDEQYWYCGPSALIFGLIAVAEDGDFVYLGFDLDGLELHGERTREAEFEALVFVLFALDGVSKAWVKVRPGSNTARELYAFHPALGGESALYKQPVTDETDWPR